MEKKIYNLKIEKVVNGYIVYTNDNVFSLNGTTKDNFPIYVFETEQALFTFISTNFNLN
jgi:hypothetical protein